MTGVLLVTHGTLAEGFRSAVNLIVGNQEQFSIIDLFEGDSVDELPERIRSEISAFENVDNVLVLVDLFGASPFNSAARTVHKMEEIGANVVTGVNLGMLLEVLMQRSAMTLDELSELAVQSGKQGIVSLADMLSKE